ncbi:MAG TPA: FUSC family protein [bacterium]|nr:FUSC family protein [bacterium]
MIPIPRPIWIYALKCVLAAAICFSLAWLLNPADFAWFLISVMLVLSPDGKEALPLALTRTKANAIGAASSLVFLLLGLPQAVGVCAAIALAVLLCHLFKAMAGSRSALAAVIILMLREPGAYLWDAALGRFASVAAGCLAGLLITLLFHRALGVVEGGDA